MVNLILLIHCHQPVGNFDKVFIEAFEKSYLPFIEVLEKHPKIKLSLHYSGSLLDWLSINRPRFIEKLRKLAKRGQVEFFAGGYYEPILTLIPEEDASAQIALLRAKIKELFSYEAKGAWITERVWEPKLPKILAQAQVEYGVVDDSHFSFIGKDPESLNGFYVTEEDGFKFNLFPGSEKLRYLWPFKLPQDTIDYLKKRERDCGGNLTITFGDDGEKFGLWPGTHKWVYQENWLDIFFRMLEENSSWINLVTFAEYAAKNKPTGRVYLPCASYREMMGWSEGFYRNFLVKYPEANNMHKRMLYVSQEISSLKSRNSNTLKNARRHLYMAQANDSYWHGVFGGLYLNHLRYAVYHHLIEAQNLIDKLKGKKESRQVEKIDFDCDGKAEVLVKNEKFNLCFRPESGAALSELDYKPKSFNLINTIARRPEAYHKKIKELIAKKDELKKLEAGTQPASIHNFTQVKEEGLEKMLFYDQFPRYCFLDHFLSAELGLRDFLAGNYRDYGDFANGGFSFYDKTGAGEPKIIFSRQSMVEDNLLKLTKAVSLKDNNLVSEYLLENLEEKGVLDTVFGIEFNFSGFNEKYAKPAEIKNINQFVLDDSWNLARIEFSLEEKSNLWVFPVETVSESETGIEKSCQEICLFFWWKVRIAAGSKWQQNFKINISA